MKKALILISVFVVIFLSFLIAAPFIYQDQLNNFVLKEINKNPSVKVSYQAPKVKIFKHFPDISIYLKELRVSPKDKDANELISVNEVIFSFDILSVLKGKSSDLKQIGLSEPIVNYTVLESGKSNWDFLKSGDSDENPSINFKIEKYYIEKGHIIYDDKLNDLYLETKNLNHSGSGDFQSNIFKLTSKTDANIEKLLINKASYLEGVKVSLNSGLDANLNSNSFKFSDNELNLNDLELLLSGEIKAEELTEVSAQFHTNNNRFSSLLSLFPVFKNDIKSFQTDGDISVSGEINGIVDAGVYPDFDLIIGVRNASLKNDKMKQGFDRISLDASIIKKGKSMDNIIVDIPKFSMQTSREPVSGSFKMTNILSNPYYDAKIKGKLNLEDIQMYYSNHEVREMSGLVDLDVYLKASQNDLHKEHLRNINAGGTVKASNVIIDSDDLPGKLYVESLDLRLKPESVTVKNGKGKIGESDVSAVGNIGNFYSYIFSDGILNGQLTVNSTYFNVNEWQEPNESASTEVYLIPDNLNLNVMATLGKVLYDEINLKNVAGRMKIKDGKIFFERCVASALGGKVNIDGMYSTVGGTPAIDLEYDVRSLDISKTLKQLGFVQKFIPVAEYINGSFNSKMSLKGDLTKEMSFDLTTLSGDGIIRVPTAKIDEIPLLEKAAKITKLDMKNWELKDAWTVVKFVNGRIEVEPFNIDKDGVLMTISGSNGFDRMLDYSLLIDVPSDKLGDSRSLVTEWLSKNPIAGLEQLIPDIIRFDLSVNGPFMNPNIILNKIGRGDDSSIKKEAKEVIAEKVDKEKEKIEEQVEEKIEEVEEEVKTKVEEKKEEVETQIEKEVEEVKDKAKDKIKDVFKIP